MAESASSKTPLKWQIELIEATRMARAANYFRRALAGREGLPTTAYGKDDTEIAWRHFAGIYSEVGAGHSQHDIPYEHGGKTIRFRIEDLPDDEKEKLQRAFGEFFDALKNKQDTIQTILKLRSALIDSPLFDTDSALCCFLQDLGNPQVFHDQPELLPDGFDIRRAAAGAILPERIAQALDDSRHPVIPPHNAFIDPPGQEGETYITLGKNKCRFPIVKIRVENKWPGIQQHLVLKNGLLIDTTDEVRRKITEHLDAGGTLNDLDFSDVPVQKHIADYLSAEGFGRLQEGVQRQILNAITEARIRQKAKDGVNPFAPCSLDEDALTGLRMDGGKESQLERFKRWLKQTHNMTLEELALHHLRHPDLVMDLNPTLVPEVYQHHKPDAALETFPPDELERFDSALPRLKYQLDKIAADIEEQKKGGTPEKKIGFVMGGTATGKGGAEKLVRSHMGDTPPVIAGLDDSRPKADPSHWFEVLTDNHGFDYADFTGFASRMRDMTIEAALRAGLPLFVDGSGIPWKTAMNSGNAQRFKEKGYGVIACATGAPLYVESNHANAFNNLGVRLEETGRGVPPKVAAEKSIAEPLAFQYVCADENVSQIYVVDTTVHGAKPIIAASCTITKEEIQELEQMRDAVNGAKQMQAFLIAKRVLREKDAAALEVPGFLVTKDFKDETYRALVILDMEHMRDLQLKGLMNPQDPEDPAKLLKAFSELSFWNLPDLPGKYQNGNGTLNLGALFRPGPDHRSNEESYYKSLLSERPTNLHTQRTKELGVVRKA